MRRSTFLVASVLMLCMVVPVAYSQDFFFDDFNDNVLDGTNWLSTTPSGSISETNQRMEFRNRGYLTTSNEYDPLSVGGLDIFGTWTNISGTAGVNRDYLQILTRSDGLVADRFRETANGIEFFALPAGHSNPTGQLRIVERVNGVASTLASTPVTYNIGDTVDFSIKDNGNDLSFTMFPQGGLDPITLTATNNRTYGTNRVVFHNRENNNGASTFSYLDEVRISSMEPPLPERRDSRLPAPSTKNNLVVVVHGWNGNLTAFQTLADSIKAKVPSDWEVAQAYDWTDLATPIPEGPSLKQSALKSLTRAINLGITEGQFIAQGNANGEKYDQVHLIGHSAGSGLINAAADQIRTLSRGTTIHLTFLDAFAPDDSFVGTYGRNGHWVEHYYTSNDVVHSNLTERPLSNAHNVDIISLSGNTALVNNHSWPHLWYRGTVESSQSNPESGEYGFGLSREASPQLWNPTPESQYPTGGIIERLPLGSGTASVSTFQQSFSDPLNFDSSLNLISDTGSVAFNGDTAEMETASPVWFLTEIETQTPVNLLSFRAEFMSSSSAEGLLSVSVDGEVVVTLDERFSSTDDNLYEFAISTIDNGSHRIGFRLDPFTSARSTIRISKVRLGTVTIVPEPSCFLLLLPVSVVLLTTRCLKA